MKIERKKSFFGRFMAFLGAFLGLFMGVQGVFFGGSSVFDRFYRGKTEYISDTLRLSETEPLKELENLIKIEITEVAEETYAPNYSYLSGSYSTKTKNGVSGGRGALNIAPLDSFAAQYNVSVVSPEIVKSPGNAIYRTGKLVYAHNAAGLFAGLSGQKLH